MLDLDSLNADFGLDIFGAEDKSKEKDAAPTQAQTQTVKSHRFGHRHILRKASSEAALENSLDWYFNEGDCYHCFSFGDVDSMSFFKHVLKQQPVEYLAISTWCMAGADVDDLEAWYDRGYIKRVDFFVGEIFPGSYPDVYEKVKAFCRRSGGRLVVFRNHSKVMIIKGERFNCLIESSANVNTNPRSENTVLTVDRELVSCYIELFAGLVSFNRDFDDVAPYREKGGGENGTTDQGN